VADKNSLQLLPVNSDQNGSLRVTAAFGVEKKSEKNIGSVGTGSRQTTKSINYENLANFGKSGNLKNFERDNLSLKKSDHFDNFQNFENFENFEKNMNGGNFAGITSVVKKNSTSERFLSFSGQKKKLEELEKLENQKYENVQQNKNFKRAEIPQQIHKRDQVEHNEDIKPRKQIQFGVENGKKVIIRQEYQN